MYGAVKIIEKIMAQRPLAKTFDDFMVIIFWYK